MWLESFFIVSGKFGSLTNDVILSFVPPGSMKFSCIIAFIFTIGIIAPVHAQQSEEEKLLAEATQNRFDNPEKALKLYDFLVKNSTAQEAVAIQIKQLQLYRLLGEYEEAVTVLSSLQKADTERFNSALKFEYLREAALLYCELDLKNEGQSFYREARENYGKLSTELQKQYAADLDLLAVKFIEDRDSARKIDALRSILRKMQVKDVRRPFIQFTVAKLYFPTQKDSATYYFRQVISAKRVSPLSEASSIYLDLLKSDRMDDHVIPKISARKLFDPDLQPLMLKSAISYFENNWNTDSLMYYHGVLHQQVSEEQLKKRAAKVALIQNDYQQKQLEDAAEKEALNRRFLLGSVLLILVISGYAVFKIYAKRRPEKAAEPDQAKGIVIPDKTEEEILEKLLKFEKSELFLDPQIRLATIAKQLDTNTRYLSSIINASKAKSFNAYINSLRIRYILDKLSSEPRYRTYKISYLAEASGFTSQSSFNTAFKEFTGYTPSAYIKNLESRRGGNV